MANDGKLNNARYELDFGIIPKIFHKDPTDFITRCLRSKDGYVCAMFNRYYELVNKVYFLDNPKHFETNQFGLIKQRLSGGVQMAYITLPSEHEGSLVYCTAYAVVWQKGFFRFKNPRLFHIVRNLGGVMTVCTVDAEGNYTDHGPTTGTAEEDMARIGEIIQKQEESK